MGLWSTLGSLVGAGLGFAGSQMSASADKHLAKKQFKYQQKMDALNYSRSLQWRKEDIRREARIRRTQLQTMVQDARRAGIHPVAALGAGNYGSSLVSATPPLASSDYGGAFNSGSTLGESLSAAGDMIGEAGALYQQDLDAEEQRKADEDERFQQILREQREIGLQERAAKSQDLQDTYTRALIEESQSRTMEARAKAAAIGGPRLNGGIPGNHVVGPFGMEWDVDPNKTPADALQSQYDDWVSGIAGVGNAAEDYLRSEAPILFETPQETWEKHIKPWAKQKLGY